MKIKFKKVLISIGLIGIIPAIFMGAYFYFTGGKGAYKVGGGLGYSRTISESKNREVFLYRLDYQIKPDSILFESYPNFFMEKGFRYGEWRASDTEPLLDTDKPYQISFNNEINTFNYDLFIEDYYEMDIWRFNSIDLDTIKYNLLTKIPLYDSIYKVGELKLFKKLD